MISVDLLGSKANLQGMQIAAMLSKTDPFVRFRMTGFKEGLSLF